MSITDELRKAADDIASTAVPCSASPDYIGVRRKIDAIADRIDAEHERLMQEQPFTIDMVPMTDESMAEHGWVRLPKDADGEYIRIGDVMEWPDTSTAEVVGVYESGFFYFDGDDEDVVEWTTSYDKVHHHAPTVEDVLTEFGIDWEHESDCEDRAALLKEYAKRLTLAKGEGE